MSTENTSNKASAKELTGRQAATKCSIPQKGRLGNFPHRLFSLLECAETKEDDGRTIAWTRDGMAFDVFQPKEFMEEVGSKWFPGQSTFRAFERQLNNWGFRMITFLPTNEPSSCSIQHWREGPSLGVRRYWHPFFCRHQPHLRRLIQRHRQVHKSNNNVKACKPPSTTRFAASKLIPSPKAPVPAAGSMNTGGHFLAGGSNMKNKTIMKSPRSQKEDRAQNQKVGPPVSLLPGMGHGYCFHLSCRSWCPFTDRIGSNL